MIHAAFDAVARLFQRPSVWQIVPPQDYRDRLAGMGAPATPPGGYPLTNHGGPVLARAKLALVYLGAWWGDAGQLEAFASDLMTCGYLDSNAVYGLTGPFSYLGAWQGPAIVGPNVADAQLQAALAGALNGGGLPQPDGQTVYALLLPSGVTVIEGGSNSCSAFCGYHDAFYTALGELVPYTVQPASDCQSCNMGDPFAAFTMVLGHEVTEAATDPIPGQGWYSDETGMENADEFAWIPETYGPWTVQGYQVNGLGNGYGPYNCEPTPAPGPDVAGILTQLDVAQLAITTARGLLGA
jgi:hypothetical protein